MHIAASNTGTPPADEPQLVDRAQRGDRKAFAVLIERYWDRLFRWLYHLSRDNHAAEDLTQDAFLKAFANLGLFRAGTNFRAWLFRIGYNALLNQQRTTGRVRPLSTDQLPAHRPCPEQQLAQQETLALVTRALKRLPREFRAALLLRAEEGLSFRQIAGVLRTTEVTARWRVFKARQKLLEVIGPELAESES
jgi:RNA polymerase sigma-70 factor (ECF subfamily)